MKATKITLTLALAAALTLVPVTTAHAGGWALTYIDAMDERITMQPATTYPINYWVLQHGNHPYQGDLGPNGLRFTDVSGAQVMFNGVALAEPAHYRVEVRLPKAGLWRITAVQGIFADYELGVLNLPGRLAAYPIAPPSAVTHDGHTTHWGAVRPPGICAEHTNPEPTLAPAAVAAPPAPSQQTIPSATVGAAGLVLLALLTAGLLVRRVIRRAPSP